MSKTMRWKILHNYVHIPLPEPIRVKTLVSAYHRHLQNHFDSGPPLNFEEIFFVLSGSYSFIFDDEIIQLNPGELLLIPPNSAISSNGRNSAEVFILTFSSGSPALNALYKRVITLSLHQSQMLHDLVFSALDILVWHREFDNFGFSVKDGTDELTVQEIKNKLELFLISLLKGSKETALHGEKLFSRVTSYFKEHIREKLTLLEIANALSISVSKLKSICATQLNTSPIEYFIELKMCEAKRLFEESNLNVSQIADYLGFSSIHYFSKLFKRKCGVSPSQYAKSIRK